jgi:hypothetical protein
MNKAEITRASRCPLLGHVTNGEDPDFEKEVGGAEGRLGCTAAGLQWT